MLHFKKASKKKKNRRKEKGSKNTAKGMAVNKGVQQYQNGVNVVVVVVGVASVHSHIAVTAVKIH